MIVKLAGRGWYYVLIALGAIGVTNLPIQVLQLMLLGNLTVPFIEYNSIFDIWWLCISFIIAAVFLLMLFGIAIAKSGILVEQIQCSNEYNKVICDLASRVKKLEERDGK